MANKSSIEALNNTLKDIRGNNDIMGGILTLFAGDFRQILPVISRSTPTDEINACLKSSFLWKKVKFLTLEKNMRVELHHTEYSEKFAKQLLNIGEGKIPYKTDSKEIEFPEDFCEQVSSVKDLIDKVFPNIEKNYKNTNWLYERAILAPRNEEVNLINNQILSKIKGKSKQYKSIDTTTNKEQSINYPTEFLNSIDPSGMPPHILNLKIGALIMVIRNLNPPKLCNGTRLIITNLSENLIEATIISGKYKNEIVLIPRIPLVTTDLTFEFKRLQFPIKLAFAITINKAQGQSLKVVGINLEKPCFSHGQLYVACTRVGNPQNLFIYTINKETKNIVYPIVLQ